ncbi:MAG TPA: outer membrane beta-barrel protein [Steroidobacteraceae bacterium]
MTALALGAGIAKAGDGMLYLGAGLSRDKVEGITHTGVPFADIDKTSWKVLAGFRPIKLFAVEADYLDLGNRTSTFIGGASTNSDAKAFAGYAVGFLPLPVPFLDVFGKVGVARWKLNGSASSAGTLPPSSFFAFSDRGTEFAWGAGAQAHVGNIGGRLEYERFRIANTNDARVFSLAVILSLL